MKINNQFSPYVAQLGAPSKDNALTILGRGIGQYQKEKDANALKALKMEDYKNKVADDKMFVKYQEHVANGGNMRTFKEEGNGFLTPEGAMMAEKLDRSRAAQNLAERKYSLAVKRANRPRVVRVRSKKRAGTSAAAIGTSSLDALNASLNSSSTPAPTPIQTSKTVYIDGKPVTVQVKG